MSAKNYGVTPVFNRAAHLAETLESVLRQEYPELEYIVVDGSSTDGTLDIICRYEARNDFPQRISLVISEPDQGMYDAIAKGFERASGDIYCYLNADDLFECDGLRSVGEYFSQHPETQVVYHEDVVLVDGWKFPMCGNPTGLILWIFSMVTSSFRMACSGGVRLSMRSAEYAGILNWLAISTCGCAFRAAPALSGGPAMQAASACTQIS